MFQRLVPFEAAGRQNHALARGHDFLLSVTVDRRSRHPAVLDMEPVAAAGEHRFNAPVQAGLEQPPDQRLAPAAQVAVGPALQFHRIDHAAAATQRRLAQHHPRRGAVLEHPVPPWAERCKIEQFIVERPATLRLRARPVLIIVRIVGHHRQLDRVDPGQETVHLPRFGDKGLENRFVHFAMIERLEIGERLGGAVRLAFRGHLLVIG